MRRPAGVPDGLRSSLFAGVSNARLAAKYRSNAAMLEQMAARAAARGGIYNGRTAAAWRESSRQYNETAARLESA